MQTKGRKRSIALAVAGANATTARRIRDIQVKGTAGHKPTTVLWKWKEGKWFGKGKESRTILLCTECGALKQGLADLRKLKKCQKLQRGQSGGQLRHMLATRDRQLAVVRKLLEQHPEEAQLQLILKCSEPLPAEEVVATGDEERARKPTHRMNGKQALAMGAMPARAGTTLNGSEEADDERAAGESSQTSRKGSRAQ